MYFTQTKTIKESAQKLSPTTSVFLLRLCWVFQALCSTMQEKSLFGDCGEGMEEHPAKFTVIYLFFWQDPLLPQNSLTDGKPPKQAFSPLENTCLDLMIKKATVGALKKKNVSKSLLPQHAPQQSSTKNNWLLFLFPFPFPIPQKKHPEPTVGALPSGQAGGQAPFWSRSEAAPLFKKTEVTKSVSQTPQRLPERQASWSVFHWKGPQTIPEGPEMHKRQCSPSRKTPVSMFFSSMAGGMWNAALKIHLQTHSKDPSFYFHYCLQVSFRI